MVYSTVVSLYFDTGNEVTMIYRKFFKRALDIFIALTILIVLSPLLLLVVLLLFIANNGKVFFVQKRPGKHEKIFGIIKFKTMNDKKNKDGELLPDKYRITKIGLLIRKTSLDEIPQLINVLKGDMSLIGPRPLLIRYLPYYTEHERLRHTVLPGITGLAQVSGRNLLNWDERLALDVKYVQNLTFLMDASIFFKTIKNVLSSKDNVATPQTVMPCFDDYRKNA